jgi:hypothetical protein
MRGLGLGGERGESKRERGFCYDEEFGWAGMVCVGVKLHIT